jgi:hypothetical protein
MIQLLLSSPPGSLRAGFASVSGGLLERGRLFEVGSQRRPHLGQELLLELAQHGVLLGFARAGLLGLAGGPLAQRVLLAGFSPAPTREPSLLKL